MLSILLHDTRFNPIVKDNLALKNTIYYCGAECLKIMLNNFRFDNSLVLNSFIEDVNFVDDKVVKRLRRNTECYDVTISKYNYSIFNKIMFILYLSLCSL